MANSQASRARDELEKQLVELSRLRNANTRDAEFKVWRQATLTLIQRVWEGDDSRSGRFRSVPFSPGSTRADAKLAREWFERGCAEAAQVLRALVDEINEHGIVKGSAVEVEESQALPEDDNVPILSLDSPGESRGPSSIADEPDDLRLSDDPASEAEGFEEEETEEDESDEILDIPDPPGARPPKPLSRPVAKASPRSAAPESPKVPARPAPPKVSPPVVSKAPPSAAKPAASSKRPAEPQIPLSETAQPGAARGVTVTNSGSKAGAKKQHLKDRLLDMLGFEPGSRYSPTAQDKSQPTPSEKSQPQSPAARQPAPPPAPAAKPAPPTVLAPPTVPAPPSAPVRPAPPGLTPRAEVNPRASDPPPAARGTPTHTPRPATPAPPVARAQTPPEITPSRPAEPAHAAPSNAEPSSGEAASEPEAKRAHDEQTLQRAFEAALQSMARRRAESAPTPEPEQEEAAELEDLLGASPVFSAAPSQDRKRAADVTGRYHTATAIAMAAIASEVDAMGLPDPDCSRARAALLELADHFERRDLTWGAVREAVRLLVEYPVVARRVLPLLVPHLDEAA